MKPAASAPAVTLIKAIPEQPHPPLLTIGVRDSGVGGLTVARCLQEALPHARLLYFADTAHVPYGGRAPEEVRHFALSIANFLIEHDAQLVVFACNTSSAVALETARHTLPVPVLGTIEPGARAAVATTENGRIGVIATQATVDSGVYSQHIHALRPDTQVWEEACPDFVPLVESEQTESEEAHTAAERHLRPLLEAGVDTVVLGCTHYPLLLPTLRETATRLGAARLRFVDPAEALSQEARRLVAELSPGVAYGHASSDEHTFFVSGESDGVRNWVHRVLGINAPHLEVGPVFNFDASHSSATATPTVSR